jgi:hypothetical protein
VREDEFRGGAYFPVESQCVVSNIPDPEVLDCPGTVVAVALVDGPGDQLGVVWVCGEHANDLTGVGRHVFPLRLTCAQTAKKGAAPCGAKTKYISVVRTKTGAGVGALCAKHTPDKSDPVVQFFPHRL